VNPDALLQAAPRGLPLGSTTAGESLFLNSGPWNAKLAKSDKGHSRRFHDIRDESALPSIADILRHLSGPLGCSI